MGFFFHNSEGGDEQPPKPHSQASSAILAASSSQAVEEVMNSLYSDEEKKTDTGDVGHTPSRPAKDDDTEEEEPPAVTTPTTTSSEDQDEEPVAKKGKRDTHYSRTHHHSITNNNTKSGSTAASMYLRSPPRSYTIPQSALTSHVTAPQASSASSSRGSHHHHLLGGGGGATVATATTAVASAGSSSSTGSASASTTSALPRFSPSPPPPPLESSFSGWETIWERFTSTNDQSRHLLRQWVSLPTIAVLGDTSSGKSSLLSQLSGLVELPSSHELTTKCPTELQMRYSNNRQATIDIHWNKQPQSSNSASSSSSSQNGLAGSSASATMPKTSTSHHRHRGRKLLWDQRVLRTPEEWKEIPNILLEAQQVILKHQSGTDSETHHHHHPNDGASSQKSTVASDVISIVLTGPMYPKQQTLTLVDMPGLVQGRHNAMTESSTVSQEILNLLQPYLTNPHCLLLAVLPANVDYHNAHALQLAAQHDPECRRTCIVWTKPDLIDPGAESAVAEWLQEAPSMLNCRHVHMVKCRGQKAVTMNESLQATLEDESHYFSTTAPWKDMDASLFGTLPLRQKLCRLQAQLVQHSLPQLLQDLQTQHAQTMAQLQALGGHKPLENAAERRQYYQTTCQRLVQELQTSLSGKKGTNNSDSKSALSARFSFHQQHYYNKNNTTILPPPLSMGKRVPPPPPPPPQNHHGNSKQTVSSGDETTYTTKPDNATSTTKIPVDTTTIAANRLHQACAVFTSQINHGSLATVRNIAEGAQVLVTSAQGTVRGEVVHLDEEEGYCCVDSNSNEVDADGAAQRILFEFTGQSLHPRSTTSSKSTEEAHNIHSMVNDHDDQDEEDDIIPRMEENDVWSDGSRVLIARAGGRTYDALRKIPLDCVWTDPTSWLQSHMAQFQTDDLPCFLNVESFAHIVQQFMHQDWTPACHSLLEQCTTILHQAMTHALEHALQVPPAPSAPSLKNGSTISWNSADAPPPRYPGLRQLLQKQMRSVADSLLTEASQQVESHLAMEAHPFTQDEALFAKMNQARYSRLKRELEVALLAELEHPGASNASSRVSQRASAHNADVASSNADAVPGILDSVFARHEQMSVQEHLAFEMELVLESYGTIATRRVLDRTPMICWNVFRTFASLLSNRLAAVTDVDLTTALVERPDLAEQYQTLQEKCDKLYESMQVLENF